VQTDDVFPRRLVDLVVGQCPGYDHLQAEELGTGRARCNAGSFYSRVLAERANRATEWLDAVSDEVTNQRAHDSRQTTPVGGPGVRAGKENRLVLDNRDASRLVTR